MGLNKDKEFILIKMEQGTKILNKFINNFRFEGLWKNDEKNGAGVL